MVKYESQDHLLFKTSPFQEKIRYLTYKAASHAKARIQLLLNFIQDMILKSQGTRFFPRLRKEIRSSKEIVIWSYFYPGTPNIVPLPFQLDEDN